jgi:general secretion pathway protein L
LNTYTYIEYLNETVTSDDSADEASNAQALYRWSVVKAGLVLEGVSSGSEEGLLEWLAAQEHPIVLVIPGEKVVLQQVPYNEKEKRHFAKMLPYELEDRVVEDVEGLHFAIGKKQIDCANIAYVDEQWFSQLLTVFTKNDFSVGRCVADFQQLNAQDKQTIFWFCGDQLLVHSAKGMGFSSRGDTAAILLQAMLSQLDDSEIDTGDYKIYITASSASANDQQDQQSIERVFHTLVPAANVSVHIENPPQSLDNEMAINFCCGPYEKKMPASQQLKEFRLLGMLAMVAILAFVSVNFADIYSLSLKSHHKKQLTEEAYRKVIPQGVVNDPVRQLARKLEQAGSSNDAPSQVVYLLSNVAPVVQALSVDLSAINYSHKEKSLRINIQADSFNQVEKIRTDINAKGLFAELLSSNAIDNKFQARLRISVEPR